MNLRSSLAPLILALAAAGCSAAIPDAEPRPSALPSTPAPSSTEPTGLAAIQACDLLTPEELNSLGVPPEGHPETVVGLRRCDWGGYEGTVSTAIDEESGIDELNLADASSVTDVEIGRHRAMRAQETSGPGFCSIFFAVGDAASVTVKALYPNDTPQACAAADQAAAFVEPKLP
ncbi:MAG: DUF3558 family protein [Pseudonocardiaceae bacterium]